MTKVTTETKYENPVDTGSDQLIVTLKVSSADDAVGDFEPHLPDGAKIEARVRDIAGEDVDSYIVAEWDDMEEEWNVEYKLTLAGQATTVTKPPVFEEVKTDLIIVDYQTEWEALAEVDNGWSTANNNEVYEVAASNYIAANPTQDESDNVLKSSVLFILRD